MKLKLIRDNTGKLVATVEIARYVERKESACKIEGGYTSEIIEAPDDYLMNKEKFFKQHER